LSEEAYEFRPIRVRLSLRTDYIFYPVDSIDFAKAIERHGYEIKSPPQAMGPLRLEITGQLAEKEGNNVILDTNRQILGVEGDDPKEITETFNELEEIIRNELKIDYSDSIKFYETIIDYHIYSPNNPRKIIENIYEESKYAEVFSSIVNKDVSPFTIRYASKGISPDSPEWMDFRIEPFVRRANKVYAFNLVYRSEDGEEVKKTLQSIQEIMEKIVKEIER